MDNTSTTKDTSTRRVRASKPKVRSGCITCKIRRVKCDESRPGCLRCKKFGRECDGYASDHANARRHFLAPLKPRPTGQPPVVTISPSPEDDQERRCYKIFCDQTAADLAGYYPTDFWRRVALQEGRTEPAIRHAIIALGALAGSTPESGMVTPPPCPSGENDEYASSQYQKAIAELRRALTKGDHPIRTSLIACLLLMCFENFHGEYEAGARHMQLGLSLLETWQTSNPPGCIADLYSEEVFQIFARHNAQSAQHLGDSRRLDPPKLFYWESIGKGVVPIPLIFANVHDARMCWDVLQERCLDYHKTSNQYRNAISPPPWIIAEADACALQLQQFEDTIWPLLQQPDDENSLIHSGATILYLRNKISAMQLQVSVVRGESHWDGFTPHFQEIISRASTLMQRRAQHKLGSFSLELGLLPALHLCATKCRQPRLRRRALALLQSYPHREGYWDGIQLHKVDSWIMQLEEEGLDASGYIPEASRWRLAEMRMSRRQAWVWARLVRYSFDAVLGRWVCEGGTRERRFGI